MKKCSECGCEIIGDYTEYKGVIRCFYCLVQYECTVLYDVGIRKAKISRFEGYLLKEYEDGSSAKFYPKKQGMKG